MEGDESTCRTSQSHKPGQSLPKPKLFSLTQSMTQLENRDNSSRALGDEQRMFKVRKAGADQNAKRAVIFPNLQRFQRPAQQQQKQKSTPFFDLLRTNQPTPTLTSSSIGPYFAQTQSNHVVPAKMEPSSDLEFSSPPPSFHEPPQMLPPPPPPTGPISRPGSRATSRSRSNSSTLCRRDEVLIDVDASPVSTPSRSAGLPDIAINALRELQTVSEELSEQRRQTQIVLSQLNALSSTHEALKTTYTTLLQENNAAQAQYSAMKVELASARDTSVTADASLASVRDDLASSQQQLGSTREDLGVAQRDVELLKTEAVGLRAELALEREDTKKKIGRARKGLVDMGENYRVLQTMFDDLKFSYDTLQDLLAEMRKARASAADGLRVLEPLLDDGGCYARASEVKALVSELQDEVSNSHRVNDLLRKWTVRELEELSELVEIFKRETGVTNGQREELLGKMEQLTKRLVKREQETIHVLADAAGLETRLALANTRVGEVKKSLEESQVELMALRDVREANRALASRLEDLATKFTVEQEALCGAHAELDAANIRLRTSETAVAALAQENKDLEQWKAESIVTLTETQGALKKAEDVLAAEAIAGGVARAKMETLEEQLVTAKMRGEEREELLRETDVRIAVLQERFDAQAMTLRLAKEHCGDVQDACKKLEAAIGTETIKEALARVKVGVLEDEVTQVKKDLLDREEVLRQANSRAILLQERLDAQAVTLRMSKEHCSDLQERLVLAEASFTTKLGMLETEAAVLKERNTAVQQVLDGVKQEAASQQAAFVGASVEFESKLAKQDASCTMLVEAERGRGDALEREAVDAKRTSAGLKERVEQLQEEMEYLTSRGEGVEGEKVAVLKAMVGELETTNRDLIARAASIRERYSGGTLSDDEKDFVDYLIKLSGSLHEQEDVAKENELRRRENMINTLQTRIRELESSLARLLKERANEGGAATKSMVDLAMWMSSSPVAPHHLISAGPSNTANETVVYSKPSVVASNPAGLTLNEPPAGPSTLATNSTCAPAKPKAKPQPKAKAKPAPAPKVKITFSALAADSDSEDDIPLSELSDVSTVLGKRDRIPSPPKVEKPRAARRLRTTTRPLESAPPSQQHAGAAAAAPVVAQKKLADPAKTKKKRKL